MQPETLKGQTRRLKCAKNRGNEQEKHTQKKQCAKTERKSTKCSPEQFRGKHEEQIKKRTNKNRSGTLQGQTRQPKCTKTRGPKTKMNKLQPGTLRGKPGIQNVLNAMNKKQNAARDTSGEDQASNMCKKQQKRTKTKQKQNKKRTKYSPGHFRDKPGIQNVQKSKTKQTITKKTKNKNNMQPVTLQGQTRHPTGEKTG